MYKFKDSYNWYTHPGKKKNKEFSRLEFLGDKVLSYEITKIIFFEKPNCNAGDLSILLAQLVCKQTLAEVGSFLIKDLIYENKLTDTIISACTEAWLGAIFLDGGDMEVIIYDLWKPLLNQKITKNEKNLLQEYAQKYHYEWHYDFTAQDNGFIAKVYMHDLFTEAFSKSKKESSILAAEKMMYLINKSM